jgi:16S rRNA (uracil1498-N3)-methyltransferase
VALSDDESRHARVLRLTKGDEVWLTDGLGTLGKGSLVEDRDGAVIVALEETRHHDPLETQVVVYQGAAKGHKLDDVVESLAQVGVAEMRVFLSERSVVRWDERKCDALEHRWRAQARAAAKQSRNPWAMATGRRLTWSELVRAVTREPHALVLWEGTDVPLRTRLSEDDRIAVVVGPEGGFEAGEVAQLCDAGADPVSLGPRILRTENAALVAASAILFRLGLLG